MKYIDEINAFHDWLITNPIPTSARVLWFSLMHYCNKCGWRKEFNLAQSALELDTGLSRDAIIKARNVLQQKGRIIFTSRKGRQSPIYEIIPFVSFKTTQNTTQSTTQQTAQSTTQHTTQGTTQQTAQSTTQHTTIPRLDIDKTRQEKNIQKKTDENTTVDEVEEIISYLNAKTGKHYKANVYKTQTLILQLMHEGFTVEDFRTVIDKKCAEWLGTEYEQYLRPITLFSEKFEGYLNQPQPTEQRNETESQYDCVTF